MSQAIEEGNSLFVNEDYHGAVAAYSKAIAEGSSSADVLARRAASYLKLEDFSSALSDASAAVAADPSHTQAHVRRGIAAFSLHNFQLARDSFQAALDTHPASTTVINDWLQKATAELAKLGPSSTSSSSSSTSSSSSSSSSSSTSTIPSATPPSATPPSATPPSIESALSDDSEQPIEILPESAYRYDWFQSPTHVTVEIFIRETTAEQVQLKVTEPRFSLTVRARPRAEYHLNFDLCEAVVPESARVTHLKSKIEVRMEKKRPAHWRTLKDVSQEGVIKATEWFASDPDAPPASREKKDWSKILAEESAGEEEKLSGDAALNKVFQDIYSRGTDEQRRAMIKSFTESGGTVLSTNWSDVGARKVEVTPPKGLEARSWTES